jgi:phosphoenolpyruvate carboxykinase (GTP)
VEWVVERLDGEGEADETAIGMVPTVGAIDRTGIEDEVDDLTMAELLSVDNESWQDELDLIRGHYAIFGDRLPKELSAQLDALERRLAG